MTTALSESARALLDAPEYATFATIEPDGRPQLSVVWVGRDGDDLLVSTVVGRRKWQNLQRDPRASLIVVPAGAPWRYLEVRGRVTVSTEGGRGLIEALSRKYTDDERYAFDDGTDNVRVVVRLHPERVLEYDAG